MTEREWLRALKVEIARMANDMETLRRAHLGLIDRTDELAAEVDRVAEEHAQAVRRLDRIERSLVWKLTAPMRRVLQRYQEGYGALASDASTAALDPTAPNEPVANVLPDVATQADALPPGIGLALPKGARLLAGAAHEAEWLARDEANSIALAGWDEAAGRAIVPTIPGAQPSGQSTLEAMLSRDERGATLLTTRVSEGIVFAVTRAPDLPAPPRPKPGKETVSIVVPTRNRPDLLFPLLETLRTTTWPSLEVVLVDNGTTDPEASRLLDESGFLVVRDTRPFNFPELINRGVEASNGEVVVMLNNDIESQDRGWLSALVDCLRVPQCGVAGALLYYPDGTVQHAGLTMDDREPVHICAGMSPTDAPVGLFSAIQPRMAVTGACLATRRALWDALGGLEPLFSNNYNDVDFCLRARGLGLVTLFTPWAVLTHKESATRGTSWNADIAAEGVLFRARWSTDTADDPWWPAGLDPKTGAPRVHRYTQPT